MILRRIRSAIQWLRTGDRWIPACFILFFVSLAVWEATLIHRAVTTFNGLVTEDTYIKGRAYDEVLAEGRRQKALGWSVSALFDQDGPTSGVLRLKARAADGAPLADAQVFGEIDRFDGLVQTAALDFDRVGPGRFEARVATPAPGRWKAEIKVRRGEDAYRLRETLVFRAE